MKKKIVISILTGLCACFMSAAFSACGGAKHTHEYIETARKSATCTETGLITYTCECEEFYTEEIPALGHDEKTHAAQAPTCTEFGWEEYVACEREGCDYSTYVAIPMLGHNMVSQETKPATCTEVGLTGYEYCQREGCGYETPSTEIPMIPHSGVGGVCGGCGISIEYTITFMVDGVMHSQMTYTKDTLADFKAPLVPEKDGFIGTWAGLVLNFTDITVNAEYVIGTYKIHYELDGGKNHKDNPETYTFGDTVVLQDPTPKGKYSLFGGWYTDKSFLPSTVITAITPEMSGEITLYAQWISYRVEEAEGFEINYDGALPTLNIRVSNATDKFDFKDKISVSKNCTWKIYKDEYSTTPYDLKLVPLNEGGNTFYLVVYHPDGEYYTQYQVSIHRRRMLTVTFDTQGGTAVSSQTVEEDHFATEPETTRVGYTFTGWSYDFATPITKTTKITALWKPNKDTKYTVRYYTENLDNSEYSIYKEVELSGTTDTLAYADIIEIAHFTHKPSATDSGNINGDGGRVLSVYYTRDRYIVATAINNTKAGTVAGSGTYRFDKEITLTATTKAGYTFLGWYDGEVLVCETEEFTFKAEKNVTYAATWSVNTDTKYTVIYYWQNIEDDNYTPYETVELKGETDTPTAEIEIKEYAHLTYNASKSTISGNIDGDGKCVLSVYYTRNTYTISVNNTSYGTITNSGTHKYERELTLTATPYLGYDFIGWYSGEELLSIDLEYAFMVDKNVTAKFALKKWMSAFEFILTKTTCKITGLKDITARQIVIPDCVTAIGDGVFSCSSLTSITIPDSVTSIGDYAFDYCDSLTSVVIGNSVASIGMQAFSGCDSLTSVHITDIEAWCKISFGNAYANPLLYAKNLYLNNELVTELVIPDSVTSIDNSAFYNCSSLTSVVIGNSVTSIGERAFQNCSSLTSVVIGNSVTSIGEYAFYNCLSLTSVVIGDSVTSIGNFAFRNCYKLVEVVNKSTRITVKKGSSLNGDVGYYALAVYNSGDTFETKLSHDNGYIIYTDGSEKILVGYNGRETDLVLHSYITKINQYAFYNCRSLTSVVIPDSVTSIGEKVFSGCSSLESITIPFVGAKAGVTESDTYQYPFGYIFGTSSYTGGTATTQSYYGSSTSSITSTTYYIPTSLKSVTITGGNILYGAFYGCSNLKGVVIGDDVTSIASSAFSDCDSLMSVVIGDGVTLIGSYAFSNCDSLTSVVIPDSVTAIGHGAFKSCDSLTSITFNDTSTWYRTTSSSDWRNKRGGASTSVTNSSTNATYFKDTYENYYWYKL